MAIQFEKRQVDKLYHAISDGRHEHGSILIEAPLGKQIKGKIKGFLSRQKTIPAEAPKIITFWGPGNITTKQNKRPTSRNFLFDSG